MRDIIEIFLCAILTNPFTFLTFNDNTFMKKNYVISRIFALLILGSLVSYGYGAGGIQKWTLSSSVWSPVYTFSHGSNIGTKGLVGNFSSAYPKLYSLVNTAFKGLSFAPIVPITIVDLSISSPTATEVTPASIIVTATASAPVVGDQTITLTPTGTASAGDYTLSGTTITILNGQTTGFVTFTAIDDILAEGTETATLTISNPSSGIVLGITLVQNIAIADNDCDQLLTLKSTVTSSNGAEISAFDPINDRIFTVAGPAFEYYTLDVNGAISASTNVPFGFTSAGNIILPNSVAIRNGIVAVSYAIINATTLAQLPGIVAFYNANDASFISQVTVGYLPDMVTFNPDGTKVLTANEGEPNSYNQATSFDPEGSVSIIDVSGGFAAPTVVTAGFTSFNAQIATLKAAGVRIYSPSADIANVNGAFATVAEDLEPEYITFNADGTKAIITLQEANAVAELDMATSTITQILPLGLKDHSLPGNGLDASDRDINYPAAPPAMGALGKINIQNWPIKGMYQPDAIASFTVAGNNYYITANEGDSRAYTGYTEEVRVSAAYNLDDTVFPNEVTLKLAQNLGRLQLTNATGDTDGDGDFDEIHALGARSFTIWNNSYAKVFDSGDQLEQITASLIPASFNSENSTAASFDSRSDNKGPEPEAVTTGMVNGILYAFVGSERTGDIFVYDISNPMAPVFKQYINTAADLGVEGLIFVSASDSPTSKALVISSAEVSKTVSVYEFSAPDCSQNVIAGIVTEDIDGGTIDGAPLSVPGAYISLFKSTNATSVPDLVVPVTSGTGAYTFPAVASDTYTLVIGTSPAGSNVASYPNVGGFSMKASAEGVAGTIGDGNANGKTKNTVSGNATIYGSAKVAAPAGVGFASAQNAPLPARLLEFVGKSTEKGNLITWNTSSEANFSHFELEKSESLNSFSFITKINGNNNLTEKSEYKYLDILPKNENYYRLKMVDIDGSFSYSKIIFLQKEAKSLAISQFYPNPSSEFAFIDFNSKRKDSYQITALDLTGRTLQFDLISLNEGEETIKYSINNLPKGLSIIQIQSEKETVYRKLIKH